MRVFLGIDIGTTSTIGVLIDAAGQTHALASRPVELSCPHPGWAEEDPEQWWTNVCALVPELLGQAGLPAGAVHSVGLTGMLPAVLLLDREGKPLRPSVQQSDSRCEEEVEALRAEIDEANFLARTGNGINQQLVTAKTRWLARHEPEAWAATTTVIGSYDYLLYRLSGELRADRNWALEGGLLSLQTGQLDPELLALGDLRLDQVPRLSASHELIGTISAEASRATGLSAGTPLCGGCADHIASAYAAGITRPGQVLLKFGGANDILLSAREARPDARVFLDYHLLPGHYMPNGCMATGGSALNWWIREHLEPWCPPANRPEHPHALLDAGAAETEPGADGLLVIPYFLGEKTPVHDPRTGAIVTGWSLHHRKEHFWRALLEGYACAFRHHVEVFRAIGYPCEDFVASDGGSRSDLWLQITADILGAPVRRLDGHPGSCLAAAWMSALASGATDDWEGLGSFLRHGATFSPRSHFRERYDALYLEYRGQYEALASRPATPRLDTLSA